MQIDGLRCFRAAEPFRPPVQLANADTTVGERDIVPRRVAVPSKANVLCTRHPNHRSTNKFVDDGHKHVLKYATGQINDAPRNPSVRIPIQGKIKVIPNLLSSKRRSSNGALITSSEACSGLPICRLAATPCRSWRPRRSPSRQRRRCRIPWRAPAAGTSLARRNRNLLRQPTLALGQQERAWFAAGQNQRAANGQAVVVHVAVEIAKGAGRDSFVAHGHDHGVTHPRSQRDVDAERPNRARRRAAISTQKRATTGSKRTLGTLAAGTHRARFVSCIRFPMCCFSQIRPSAFR